MARLPQPGGDNGNWGTILNDFLSQALKSDGMIKDNAVTANNIAPNSITSTKIATDAVGATQIADGSINETLLSTDVQTKLNTPGTIGDGTITKSKLASAVQTTLDKADSALQVAPVTSVATRTGAVTLTKADVGLGNIDNTSDTNKPISTLAQSALDAKAPLSHSHIASQISDATTVGRSVLTAADAAAVRTAIGAGISNLSIGTTPTTAKAGDYVPTKTEVGLGNVDNTSDMSKPVSSAQQVILDTKASLVNQAASELCARMTIRPTRARRALIESLISSLMTSGVWAKLDGLYLFASHDVQAAKLNWIGCAQDVTAINSPTFQTDRGFTGNGTSSYLDTNTIVNTLEKYAANDATLGVYNRTAVGSSTYIDANAGSAAYLNPSSSNQTVLRANSSAGGAITISNGGNTTGLFAWSRDASNVSAYRAGSLLGSSAVGTGSLASTTVMFLRASAPQYSARQLAVGFFGQGLSATEHASLNTALVTYLSAIGGN